MIKDLFLFIGLFVLNVSYGQVPPKYIPLSFALKSNSPFFKPNFFKPELKNSADSALIIAAAVLNSEEFRDSIFKYSFPCKNYRTKCGIKCSSCDDLILSKVVMDSLYRLKRDSLTLILLNDGMCDGSFGFSYEDKFEITSHYITIDCDDKSLSFAYKYAYHICHEYMHIVGFYHFLKPRRRIRNKDIAEKTGWIAYDILKRWYKADVEIKGL